METPEIRPSPTSVDPRGNGPPEEPKLLCPLDTATLCDRVMEFVQALTAIPFYTYQYVFARRIVESILLNDGDYITGLWSRQSGKTETLANLGFGMCVILPSLAMAFPDDPRLAQYRKGFWIGIFAPILEQATISFQRMRALSNNPGVLEILADPGIGVQITVNRGDTLAFSNGSFIQARSASPDSQIEGKTFHLIMLEESQKLTYRKVEKEIVPMLASTNGTMAKIGTAWTARGGFHTSIQHNITVHKRTGKRNHFEFPYNLVIAEKRKMYEKDKNPFHLNYEKFVNKELAKLGGENSLEFRMNFKCEWNESKVIAVDPEVLKSLRLEDVEAQPIAHGFQVAGLDIGKINDSSVLTVMHVDLDHPYVNPVALPGAEEDKQVYYRKTILDWLMMEGAFEGSNGQYQTIVDYLRYTSVKILCVDTTGVGDAYYERLEAMLGDAVLMIPMNFALPNKARLYKYYLQELHARRVWYASGPQTQSDIRWKRFVQENEDLEREQIGQFVVCHHPDIDNAHDDFPDSAALACWAEHEAPLVLMPEVQVSSLDMVKFQDSKGHVEVSRTSRYSGSREDRYRASRGRRR